MPHESDCSLSLAEHLLVWLLDCNGTRVLLNEISGSRDEQRIALKPTSDRSLIVALLLRLGESQRSALQLRTKLIESEHQHMILSDADIAMATSYAIHFQLLTFHAVRKWGDTLLETNTRPPLWAIDLADCHVHDFDERLRSVPGKPNAISWQNLLCGLISYRWARNQITIGTMRGAGWMLYIEHHYEDVQYWGLELECVGDAYDDGWGTLEEVERKCSEISQRFAPLRSLVPAWMLDNCVEPSDAPKSPNGAL